MAARSIAFVTGGSGQTGSYVVEQLLEAGWEVHCLARPGSSFAFIAPEAGGFHTHTVEDCARELPGLFRSIRPSHVFHFAAQSSPANSFRNPRETFQANTLLTLDLLEACLLLSQRPRFLHASTGEIFGTPDRLPLHEDLPLRPVSPYGVSKAAAHQLVRVYRDSHGLKAFNAILLSHESPRRGETFVTRKVARAAARISLGLERALPLGNVEARRDWGWAPDYARGCVLTLTSDVAPQDFMFATGVSHTVAEWIEACFDHVGLNWREHVRTDAAFARPSDIPEMRGDSSRAQSLLGWTPTKGFREIAAALVDAELSALRGI